MQTKPFTLTLDRRSQTLQGYSSLSVVTLESIRDIFEAPPDKSEQTKEVYRVYKKDVPLEEGELLQCLTILRAGTVGGEFFMTRGHNHKNLNCAEIYTGISGRGVVLMQRDDTLTMEELYPGRVVYIPGGWAHRTVNTSLDDDLLFHSVWPAQSGYDYTFVLKHPFMKRLRYSAEQDIDFMRTES